MPNTHQGLAGTVALLAATIALIFAIALTTDDDPAVEIEASTAGSEPSVVLDSDELLQLGLKRTPDVARRVAEIRGLEFDKIPKPQVTDVEALRELATEEAAKPKIAEALATGDAELKLLGLLEPGDSLADTSTDVTADAAAFYDPRKQELFLLGDAVPAGPALTEFVLSHELNHALEDQAFGLPNSGGRSDDTALAHTAFVEGSATALMTEYAREHLSSVDLLDESAGIEDSSADLPHIALAQVMFSYLDGQRFIEELLRSAEGRWDLVDFAYERRLPETTEQILHPEKYLDDEGPLPVAGPADAGPGWTEADSGTVGEFMTREILRQDATDVGADAGAAGWGGDRYRLFTRKGATAECTDECRSDHALAIEWRGDNADEAAELQTALEDYVERALGGTATVNGVWELEDGWAVIEGIGDRTTLALAPDETLARSLARPVG